MIIAHLDVQDSLLLKSNDRSFHALYHIMSQMNKETNEWYADNTNKTAICNCLSISRPALEKMIGSLKSRGIIISIKRGLFMISLEIFECY